MARGMGLATRGAGRAVSKKQTVAVRGYKKGGIIEMPSAGVRVPKRPSPVGAGVTEGNLSGKLPSQAVQAAGVDPLVQNPPSTGSSGIQAGMKAKAPMTTGTLGPGMKVQPVKSVRMKGVRGVPQFAKGGSVHGVAKKGFSKGMTPGAQAANFRAHKVMQDAPVTSQFPRKAFTNVKVIQNKPRAR